MEKQAEDKCKIKDYINDKKELACVLSDRILDEIEKKIQDAPLNQLSSVLGTLLDKFGADEKAENSEGQLAKIFQDFEDIR